MIEILNELYEMVESMTRYKMKLYINNFYTLTKTKIIIERKKIFSFTIKTPIAHQMKASGMPIERRII